MRTFAQAAPFIISTLSQVGAEDYVLVLLQIEIRADRESAGDYGQCGSTSRSRRRLIGSIGKLRHFLLVMVNQIELAYL